MKENNSWLAKAAACSVLALSSDFVLAQQSAGIPSDGTELGMLRRQVEQQSRELEKLKRALSEQEARNSDIRRALGIETLANTRGAGTASGNSNGTGSVDAGAATSASVQTAQSSQAAATDGPRQVQVGTAPSADTRTIAPLFEQPGILTPRGKTVFEPSLQYG